MSTTGGGRSWTCYRCGGSVLEGCTHYCPTGLRANLPDPQPPAPEASRAWANRNLIAAVQAVWEMHPDWRFGQLVMNLSREPGGFADTWEWSNAQWLDRIQALAGKDAG